MKVSPKRPERAEAPSPGQRPGLLFIFSLLPLQGVLLIAVYTQGVALGYGLLPFQGVWRNLASAFREPHAKVLLLTQIECQQVEGHSLDFRDGGTVEFGGWIHEEGLPDVELAVVKEPVLVRNLA